MFETAELGRKLSKEDFKQREPDIRKRLLDAQFRLDESKTSVVVIIAGMEAAGKGETVNLLVEWLDPRGIEVHAMGEPTEEERERPPWWRYWRRLPRHGKIAVFIDSWYAEAIRRHYRGETDYDRFEHTLRQITEQEAMFAAEGVLLVKFYLHISKKEQKKQLKKLEGDSTTTWRVTESDWEQHKAYKEIEASISDALRITSTGRAPWHVVEAADKRYRHMTMGETLAECMESKLDEPAPPPEPKEPDAKLRAETKKKADGGDDFVGFILSPLGVQPEFQKNGIGSKLIEYGVRHLSNMGVNVVFVYGDPEYYGRFGFSNDVGRGYTPPYELRYPSGWQAIALNKLELKKLPVAITCVASLANPLLW